MSAIKIFAQMFFRDGSSSERKIVDFNIYESENDIATLITEFLHKTSLDNGIAVIWGLDRVAIVNAQLLVIEGDERLMTTTTFHT